MRKKCPTFMPATMLALCVLVTSKLMAGSLDPTNAPGATTLHTLEDIYQKVQNLSQTTQSLTVVTVPPVPTMHTLDDIYQKVQNLVPPTTQSLAGASSTVAAGYYAATNLTQADADLVAANIRTNVTLFGVVGTMATNAGGGSAYPAMVPKTGQTNVVGVFDDGMYQAGVAWPNPRFTVQPSGDCVQDNLTGLMWARNGNPNGYTTFTVSLNYCEGLTLGGRTDWRMPNIREMMSLVYLASTNAFLLLPDDHPFTNVASSSYWTSTKAGNYPFSPFTWIMMFQAGTFDLFSQAQMDASGVFPVWPVRGP